MGVQRLGLVVGVVVSTDAGPVDELDAAGWPRGSALEKLLRQPSGRYWTTWLTWHPGAVLSMNAALLKLGIQQRSRHGSSAYQCGQTKVRQLTPIFSKSSSSSDGRAATNVGPAGMPTHFAIPDRMETS